MCNTLGEMNDFLAVLGFTSVGLLLAVIFYRIEGNIMGINETLKSIKDSLSEATAELVGKIAALQAQVAAGEVVDPALLAEVKDLADGLAAVVDDAPEEVVDEVDPPEVVGELVDLGEEVEEVDEGGESAFPIKGETDGNK